MGIIRVRRLLPFGVAAAVATFSAALAAPLHQPLPADSLEQNGAPLFAANAGNWSNPGNGNSFVTAMEANGRVYVPADKTVTVFGLTN